MSLDVFAPAAELALAATTARERLAFQESLRRLIDCFSALDEARFPIVCAIQGGCIGGALDLAAACDLRVCSADAFFTVQEISIGMAADLGVLQRLPRSCRRASRARWRTRASASAPSARSRSGLVNAVLPDAAATVERALALAGRSPRSRRSRSPAPSSALNHARDHSTASALQQMTLLQSAIFDTGEMAARSPRGGRSRRVRAAGRDRPALRHAGRGHRADAVRRPRLRCCATGCRASTRTRSRCRRCGRWTRSSSTRKVTYFVGENGSGKSTLIEAIAVAAGFNAEGGSRNFEFATRASRVEPARYLRIARLARGTADGYFLRAESFFNVATEIEQLGVLEAYGGRSLHEQSHGESFLACSKHRFGPHGLYLLDEPEAALSPRAPDRGHCSACASR